MSVQLLIIGLHGRLVAMSIAVFFGFGPLAGGMYVADRVSSTNRWLLCSILLCTLLFTIEADQVKRKPLGERY